MLPATSRFHEAMALDEESIRAYVEQNNGQLPKSDPAPDLHTWTPEVSVLTKILEELRAQRAILVKINSKPGASVPNAEPEPRPKSAWPKIEAEVRLGKHYALVARLLPKKGAEAPPQ